MTAVQACRGGLGCRLGAGHGEERTLNMDHMAVTLDVSKFSGWSNANAPYRDERRGHTTRDECGPEDGRVWCGGGAKGAHAENLD